MPGLDARGGGAGTVSIPAAAPEWALSGTRGARSDGYSSWTVRPKGCESAIEESGYFRREFLTRVSDLLRLIKQIRFRYTSKEDLKGSTGNHPAVVHSRLAFRCRIP